MFQHPNYDSGPGFTQNDIAVVQATSAISGTNIAAGQMASDSSNPGGNGWITGWGRTCGKITATLFSRKISTSGIHVFY